MAKRSVLIVDDEPSIRAVLLEALEGEGYAVFQAANGISALDVLKSEAQIDLLITDIGLMDGMNGRELAKAARRARPCLKVLLITGYGAQRIARDGPLQPGEYALMKPFSMESMVSLVEGIISDEPGPSVGEQPRPAPRPIT